MNITNTQQLRQAVRNPYAWPGGYPTYIILYDGEYLCHDCARSNYKQLSNALRHHLDDGWRPVAHEIYDEGPPKQCAHCSKKLESAYGDTDDTEEHTHD